MAVLPPFLLGGVIGVLLKRGYDQLQPRLVKAPASRVTVVSTPSKPVEETPSAVMATPAAMTAVPPAAVTAAGVSIPPVTVDVPPVLEPTAVSTPVAADTEVVAPLGAQDDLAAINGIGPVYASRLQAAGIYSFSALAQLSPERIQEIIGSTRSGHMIDAESWIAEARLFADGGKALDV